MNATKSERLELRLDTPTIDRLDAWRSTQYDSPSRSEAMRRLVDLGLESQNSERFRLDNTDKLQTWMLSEILKNQINERKNKTDNKYDLKTVELIQEVIYGGHFWALQWEMTGVLHDHADDPEKVSVVVNVLDMWNFIERAYEDFSDAEKKYIEDNAGFRGKNPRFLGFDGNNETEYLGIARFLVEQLGRFERFKGRSFNSHLPTVHRYSQMYRRFEPMRTNLIGRELSVEEVLSLVKLD